MATKKTSKSKSMTKGKKPPASGKRNKAANDGRSDTRIPIQLLVDYKSEGHYLFDFCKDLGVGGVFIQTEKPLDQGSNIDLTFTIPDSKETLTTKGKVIWVQPPVTSRDDLTPGMGIQFSSFSGDQRKVLEDFVRRYHGDKLEVSSDGDQKAS